MADKGKEDAGQSLLRDLLVRIAGDQKIKKALLELQDVRGEELVQEIIDELEAVVERLRGQRLLRLLDPGPLRAPDFDVRAAAPPVPGVGGPENPAPEEEVPLPARETVEDVPPGVRSALPVEEAPVAEPSPPAARDEDLLTAESPPEGSAEELSEDAVQQPEEQVENEESFVALTKHHQVRIPVDLADDDWFYFHGVSRLSGDEEPVGKPFMIEEKGIDNREFAFAFDRGGLRFYLSRVIPGTLNVSKNGTVLLNKQDSLRLRGVHAGILNDLRLYGIVLPFDFGTVALGKSRLLSRIDGSLPDIAAAVDELEHTSLWHLAVYMLDARLAQLLGSEKKAAPRRERERPSYQQLPPVHRVDIKTMERILNRQKKIAETIHEEISTIAETAKVEMMVGLSSGTSDDWKPILRSTYEVHPRFVARLNRIVTDIQYRHMLFEMMVTLSGEREFYAFAKGR